MGLIDALVAAGLSLIFGLMDVVNFAHARADDGSPCIAVFAICAAAGLDPMAELSSSPASSSSPAWPSTAA
jgi:branched-chain amino acid transport system permease protein